MKHIWITGLLFSISLAAGAVSNPQAAVQTQTYDRQACIDNNAAKCINTLCLTSSDRNCTSKCRSSAEAQCLNKQAN